MVIDGNGKGSGPIRSLEGLALPVFRDPHGFGILRFQGKVSSPFSRCQGIREIIFSTAFQAMLIPVFVYPIVPEMLFYLKGKVIPAGFAGKETQSMEAIFFGFHCIPLVYL
jgi:hypothetical protein